MLDSKNLLPNICYILLFFFKAIVYYFFLYMITTIYYPDFYFMDKNYLHIFLKIISQLYNFKCEFFLFLLSISSNLI